jgi:uncharacterized protein (DUF1330 family)
MAKGYWIVRVDVSDPDQYKKYVAANAEPIARFGGRFIVRAGEHEAVEGEARARNIVLEFPSYQAARDCYHSDLYEQASKLRRGASVADFLIIEGYDGPQPGD